MSISNTFSFELSIQRILKEKSITVSLTNNNWAPNQHIRMISPNFWTVVYIDLIAQTCECWGLTIISFGQCVPTVDFGCSSVPFAVDVGVVIAVVVKAVFGVFL